MVLLIKDLLTAERVAAIRASLGRDDRGEIAAALRAHPLFVMSARPRAISAPIVSRRDASIAAAPPLSSDPAADLRVVVYLSDPCDYDGGDYLIDTGFGFEPWRPPAGAGVAFAVGARSAMAPITRGECWTAEMTAQSWVRAEQEREILYTIELAGRYLEMFGKAEAIEARLLRECGDNLSRLWASR